MNPEVFYLKIEGEQRGPYTVSQIDHLLNSGLIPDDVTFWREGMEEWQPVTNLVVLRRPVRHWARRAVLAVLVLLLLALGRLFGPTIVVGWRETAQYDFTPRDAWWRARDIVRSKGAPPGAVLVFPPFDPARVEMHEQPAGATVRLPGEIQSHGNPAHHVWTVDLSYDARLRLWSGRQIRPDAP